MGTNALALLDGRLAASIQAGDIQFHDAVPPDMVEPIRRALRIGAAYRLDQPAEPVRWDQLASASAGPAAKSQI